MSRILYVWELGADFGHISAFLPVARRLRERGHEVVLAVKDLVRAESVLGEDHWPVLQAPIWMGKATGLPEPILTYGDILLRTGFIDKRVLGALVKGWRQVFTLTAPDLLIMDHSPRALVAALSGKIPRALTGNGFSVPPPVSPMPNLQPWLRPPLQRLQTGEQKALEITNQVLFDLGTPELETMVDLFNVEENFLCTFPELDPYGNARGTARHWGPISVAEWGVRAPWPDGGGQRIFAYLKVKYGQFEKLLQVLTELPCSTLVYASGVSDKVIKAYSCSRLHFSSEPVDMAYARETCDLAICHGGHGTTNQMLLAGRPLLLLPTYQEQGLRALSVQDLGAGLAVVPGLTNNPDYRALIMRLIEEESFTERARAFARQHKDHDPEALVEEMAVRCEELM
jgi:hypothetical protein